MQSEFCFFVDVALRNRGVRVADCYYYFLIIIYFFIFVCFFSDLKTGSWHTKYNFYPSVSLGYQ